jgi:acyl-CoA thioester hydrolase
MEHFRTRRRVEFADTDASGLAHFARFLVFMESAEHEFLRSLGVGPGAYVDGERRVGWPRVAASCEYRSPARFGDELDILLSVVHRGRTSLGYAFELRSAGTLVARGSLTTVCCEIEPGGAIRPIPLPPALATALAALPEGSPSA